MTLQTIYLELKKAAMQMIPHCKKSIEEQQKGAQFMVLADHHLGLALYYLTKNLKENETEVLESGELHTPEGRGEHTTLND